VGCGGRAGADLPERRASTAPTKTWRLNVDAVPDTARWARMQGHYPGKGKARPRLIGEPVPAEPGSGRLFLCAACRVQAIICSCCDRGQVYCAGECAGRARRQSQRAAGQRYQTSRRGRLAHAARMRRWRARPEKVTHQGSPAPPAAAVLRPGATTAARDTARPADQPRGLPTTCHWCGRPCRPWLRQGFLRRRHGHRGRDADDRRRHHGDPA
jgi:hypothetical protein